MLLLHRIAENKLYDFMGMERPFSDPMENFLTELMRMIAMYYVYIDDENLIKVYGHTYCMNVLLKSGTCKSFSSDVTELIKHSDKIRKIFHFIQWADQEKQHPFLSEYKNIFDKAFKENKTPYYSLAIVIFSMGRDMVAQLEHTKKTLIEEGNHIEEQVNAACDRAQTLMTSFMKDMITYHSGENDGCSPILLTALLERKAIDQFMHSLKEKPKDKT